MKTTKSTKTLKLVSSNDSFEVLSKSYSALEKLEKSSLVKVRHSYKFLGETHVKIYGLTHHEYFALQKVEKLMDDHTSLGETYVDDSLNDMLTEMFLNILQESTGGLVKEYKLA